MKAIVLREHGGFDALSLEPGWPDPVPADDEVVVKVRACALNYHDLFTLRGMPGIKVPMPIIMGLDIAGEIERIGSGVIGWAVGDRVLVDPFDVKKGKLIGEMMNGGLAQYCAVGAHTLLRLADDTPFDAAAALPVAYGTAYRMMVTRGRIRAGEKVLVLGASGGVGTCCIQLAKLAGAHVIAAASSSEKLEKLARLGADEGIDYKTDDFMAVVHRRFGKPRVWGAGGVDVVVNFTGGDTWVPSLRALAKGGRLLTCGATAGFDPRTDLRFVWTFELNVLGSNGWEREDLHSLLALLEQRRLMPSIGGRFGLAGTATALKLLEERQVVGKLIIDPWA